MHFTQLYRASGMKAMFLIGMLAGFLCAAFAQTYTGESSNRVTINMGEAPWKFQKGDFFTGTPSAKDSAYNDAAWNDVSIPHCVNALDSWRNNEHGMLTMYKGFFWYRKHFTIDAIYSGRRIELEFQGVNIACAVYINGKFKSHISSVTQPGQVTHVNGHIPFLLDITDDVRFGAENVIAVRGNNEHGNSQFFTSAGIGDQYDWAMGFGGIHRPVYLHITDRVHVPQNVYSNIRRWGTYVGTTAASSGSAAVRLQTNVYNDNAQSKSVAVTTKIVDAQNTVVATQTSTAQTINTNSNFIFDQTATVQNPHLWYPANNANGSPYMYKVYHIVQVAGQTVDVFTSPLGIRVITWDNNFAYFNGKKHLFWGFGCRYEYPGFGSAVPEEQQWRDVKLAADCGGSMLRPGHAPTTPITVEACDIYGVCLFENTTDNEWAISGTTPLKYKDEFHRDCIIRDRNHPSIAVWELNNGVGSNTSGLIKKLIDTIKAYDYIMPRAASSRDNTDYIPTSPGVLIVGSLLWYSRKYNQLPAWGAESWCNANARDAYQWEVNQADRYIGEVTAVKSSSGLGYAHWMLMECGGESYAKFNDPAILDAQRKTLGCSAMDHNRIPKLIYNVYKNAAWIPYATRPGVALQSHWNYSSGNRTVTAYSNCPSVELFINGVSKGVKTPNASTTKCEWTNVAWEAGTLRAVGKNSAGTVVCSDERKTAGAPRKIVLSIEPALVRPDNGAAFKIRANGLDAAFILATIVDSVGNWCPLATNNITFSASGAGIYVGSANFFATLGQPDTYHAPGSPELAAEGGMMKVAVRATFTPGSFTVGATSPGLTAANSVTVTTFDPKTEIKPFVATPQPSIMSAGSKTFKIAGTSFTIPREFSGKAVSVEIYDLSGKLLWNKIVKTKRISFARYGINVAGMYIVRCREFQPVTGK